MVMGFEPKGVWFFYDGDCPVGESGSNQRRMPMLYRTLLSAMALAMAWPISPAPGQLVDLGKYPDLKGQWRRVVNPGIPAPQSHDQPKPSGFGQETPLTPEYARMLETSLADVAKGGLGFLCISTTNRSSKSV